MPDVTICLTSDEVTEKLAVLPGLQPSDMMGRLIRIQAPENQSPYVRLKLWSLYRELGRRIGAAGPQTPQDFFSLLIYAGSFHSDQFTFDDATIKELQDHMRDVLIPALIDDEAARTATVRLWDQYFGITAEGSR